MSQNIDISSVALSKTPLVVQAAGLVESSKVTPGTVTVGGQSQPVWVFERSRKLGVDVDTDLLGKDEFKGSTSDQVAMAQAAPGAMLRVLASGQSGGDDDFRIWAITPQAGQLLRPVLRQGKQPDDELVRDIICGVLAALVELVNGTGRWHGRLGEDDAIAFSQTPQGVQLVLARPNFKDPLSKEREEALSAKIRHGGDVDDLKDVADLLAQAILNAAALPKVRRFALADDVDAWTQARPKSGKDWHAIYKMLRTAAGRNPPGSASATFALNEITKLLGQPRRANTRPPAAAAPVAPSQAEQAAKAREERERAAEAQAAKVREERERAAEAQSTKAREERERAAEAQAAKARDERERAAQAQAAKAKEERERAAEAAKVSEEREQAAEALAAKAKEERERAVQEQAAKAQEERERAAKAKEERERAAKELAAKAKEERERAAEELAAKAREERDRLAKEQAAKAKEARERAAAASAFEAEADEDSGSVSAAADRLDSQLVVPVEESSTRPQRPSKTDPSRTSPASGSSGTQGGSSKRWLPIAGVGAAVCIAVVAVVVWMNRPYNPDRAREVARELTLNAQDLGDPKDEKEAIASVGKLLKGLEFRAETAPDALSNGTKAVLDEANRLWNAKADTWTKHQSWPEEKAIDSWKQSIQTWTAIKQKLNDEVLSDEGKKAEWEIKTLDNQPVSLESFGGSLAKRQRDATQHPTAPLYSEARTWSGADPKLSYDQVPRAVVEKIAEKLGAGISPDQRAKIEDLVAKLFKSKPQSGPQHEDLDALLREMSSRGPDQKGADQNGGEAAATVTPEPPKAKSVEEVKNELAEKNPFVRALLDNRHVKSDDSKECPPDTRKKLTEEAERLKRLESDLLDSCKKLVEWKAGSLSELAQTADKLREQVAIAELQEDQWKNLPEPAREVVAYIKNLKSEPQELIEERKKLLGDSAVSKWKQGLVDSILLRLRNKLSQIADKNWEQFVSYENAVLDILSSPEGSRSDEDIARELAPFMEQWKSRLAKLGSGSPPSSLATVFIEGSETLPKDVRFVYWRHVHAICLRWLMNTRINLEGNQVTLSQEQWDGLMASLKQELKRDSEQTRVLLSHRSAEERGTSRYIEFGDGALKNVTQTLLPAATDETQWVRVTLGDTGIVFGKHRSMKQYVSADELSWRAAMQAGATVYGDIGRTTTGQRLLLRTFTRDKDSIWFNHMAKLEFTGDDMYPVQGMTFDEAVGLATALGCVLPDSTSMQSIAELSKGEGNRVPIPDDEDDGKPGTQRSKQRRNPAFFPMDNQIAIDLTSAIGKRQVAAFAENLKKVNEEAGWSNVTANVAEWLQDGRAFGGSAFTEASDGIKDISKAYCNVGMRLAAPAAPPEPVKTTYTIFLDKPPAKPPA